MLLEILTDVGVFTAKIEPAEYAELNEVPPTEALLFEKARNDACTGCSFYGWTPTDSQQSDRPRLFAIENKMHIISTKLYMEVDTTEQLGADATPTLPTKGMVYDFDFYGEYLGNAIHVEGYAVRTDTSEYLLPRLVNGVPSYHYMKASALSQQVHIWKDTQGVAPTEYDVIVPDVAMDCTDALEYLADYVTEAEPPCAVHGDGTAKAWPGWQER